MIFLLSFVSQFFIEIKFFSASPRLRGATGFLRFFSVSPCLRGGFWVWLWLCYAVSPWWVLVVARLRCGEEWFGCGSVSPFLYEICGNLAFASFASFAVNFHSQFHEPA